MRYYPVGLDLVDQPVLLVGAGSVAARKLLRLIRARAKVTIVAPAVGDVVRELATRAALAVYERAFVPSDVDGVRLIVAATGQRDVNREIALAARQRSIPVNVVDDPGLSSAVLPAVIERGLLQIAIATSGVAPALASWLRARIEAWLDPALDKLLALLDRRRDAIRETQPDPRARRAVYHAAAGGDVIAALRRGDEHAAHDALDALLAGSARRGRVTLVGAGPGDPDLLTLAALRSLGDADIVFHDRLVGEGVLKLARADAEIVDVGKRCGQPSASQPKIIEQLIAAARAGHQVVRLKGGDALTFARGGEELLALRAAGVDVEVIPGISAAFACAAAAGIPLTHRRLARSVRFVTAHSETGLTPFELLQMRHDETLAVYMGSQRAAELAAAFLRAGVSTATPIALIENASLPGQRVHRGTLAQLVTLCEQSSGAPALLLVGAVCALSGEALQPQSAAPDKLALSA